MIDTNGRGLMFGYEAARKVKRPLCHLRLLARLTFRRLDRAGYAHISPEAQFVESFVSGFQQTIGGVNVCR